MSSYILRRTFSAIRWTYPENPNPALCPTNSSHHPIEGMVPLIWTLVGVPGRFHCEFYDPKDLLQSTILKADWDSKKMMLGYRVIKGVKTLSEPLSGIARAKSSAIGPEEIAGCQLDPAAQLPAR
jgi:hypothetical protein